MEAEMSNKDFEVVKFRGLLQSKSQMRLATDMK